MSQEKEKKLKSPKNVELRIIIVGENGVGKKSITKRFKLLNCTETKEILFSILEPINSKTEKSQKNNIYYYDLDETFIEEEQKKQKKEEERLNLTKFIKIYKINLNSIEISFYPCAEAEQIPYDYIPSEDNENNKFELENKISLKKLINEIAQIIMKPLSSHKNNLKLLFLFCFDLSNRNSFKQLKLYYSQINRHFRIKDNYHSILVGNKIDKKCANNIFYDSINQFISQNGLKYYEISTFMLFNFENFFEKIFYQVFENFSDFSEEAFKNKFHNILEQKPTFLLSERKLHQENNNPSPNKYKNNQYEYPKKVKDLVNLFQEKEKYNKKIFINKEGPVFPPLPKKNIFKENLSDASLDKNKNNEIDNKQFLHSKSNNDIFLNSSNITKVDIIKYKSPIIYDSEKQKEIKDLLTPVSRKKGYSIGITTTHSLGLMKDRREKNIKINLDVYNAFNRCKLNIKKNCIKKGELKQEKYEKNRKEQYKKKLEEIKTLENEKNERHKLNQNINNNIKENKNKIIMEKEQKYLKNYIKRQKEKFIQQKKSQKINIIKSGLKNIIKKCEFYSPISSIQTNKGFTFGQKLEIKRKVDSPDFPNLLDDFEKIVIKNEKRINVKGAERFSESKVDTFEEDLDYSNSLKQNQKIFDIKRKNFIKNKIANFIKDRKNKINLVKINKDNLLKEEEKQFNTQMFNQYKTASDYFSREINYNLVENSSPKYSITGKYKYHPSISHQAYYGSSDDIFENFENDEDDDNSKKLHILLENPNYDKVKPKYPSFSFGISERFKTFNPNKLKKFKSNVNIINNDVFIDGNFGQQDTKSFLKAQTIMGTEKKFRCYKDNGVPGPGNYKIKSFADDILKKGILKNKRNVIDKLGEKFNNFMDNKYIKEKIKI